MVYAGVLLYLFALFQCSVAPFVNLGSHLNTNSSTPFTNTSSNIQSTTSLRPGRPTGTSEEVATYSHATDAQTALKSETSSFWSSRSESLFSSKLSNATAPLSTYPNRVSAQSETRSGYKPSLVSSSNDAWPSHTAVNSTRPKASSVNGYPYGYNTTVSANPTGNGTLDVGSCWNQWISYWSLSNSPYSSLKSPTHAPTHFTTTWTTTYKYSGRPGSTSTFSTSYESVTVVTVGGFPHTTESSGIESTTTFTFTSVAAFTDINTFTSISGGNLVQYTSRNASVPSCILPSVVPQCQAQWESYASQSVYTTGNGGFDFNTGPVPSCTYASLGKSLCSTMQDKYQSVAEALFLAAGYAPNVWGYQSITTTLANGSISTAFTWPSAKSLGPSCSLGCASCAVTGGTVRLLYWPEPETATESLTAYYLGTSFVYPTAYISYGSVYASDSCGPVGPTYSSTIVPITNTHQLSSLFVTSNNLIATASFNFTDLNSPVPSSIYYEQLRCNPSAVRLSYEPMGLSANLMASATPQNKSYACEPNGPYEPVLVVPSEILRDLNPAWASCSADIRGQYDPPHALTAASAPATPTSSPMFVTTPAAPASPPLPTQPLQTASPTESHPLPGDTSSPNDPANTAGSDPGSGEPGKSSTALAGLIPSILQGSPPAASSSSLQSYPGDPGAQQTPPAAETGPTPSSPTGPSDPDDPNPGLGGSIASEVVSGIGSGSAASPARPDDPESPAGATSNSVGAAILSGLQVGAPAPSAGPAHPAAPAQTETVIGSNAGTSADPGVSASGSNPKQQPPSQGQGAPVVSTGNEGGNSPGQASGPQPEAGGRAVPPDSVPGSPSVGGLPIAADHSNPGALVIGGTQTVQPGGTAIVQNTPVSLGSGGLVIMPNSGAPGAASPTTIPILQPISPPNVPTAIFMLGSAPLTASQESGHVVIAGSTLSAGGPAATLSGQVVSVGSSGVIVGGSTHLFSAPATGIAVPPQPSEVAAPFTVGGMPYTAYAPAGQSGVAVLTGADGVPTTLMAGGPAATISGQAISVGSSGIVVAGSTYPFLNPATGVGNQAQPSEGAALFMVDGSPYTAYEPAGQSGIAVLPGINGVPTILSAGGPAATISGQAISVGSSGLVVGGSTIPFSALPINPAAPGPTGPQEVAASFTIGGQAYTAYEAPGQTQTAIINGPNGVPLTLSEAGPAATISNQAISLGPSGLLLDSSVVPFSTLPLILPTPVPTLAGAEPLEVDAPFTIAGTPYTAYQVSGHSDLAAILGPNGVVITTLAVGGSAATLDGQAVSLGAAGVRVGASVSGSDVLFVTATATLERDAVFTDAAGHAHTAVEAVLGADGDGDGDGDGAAVTVDGSVTISPGAPATVLDGETVSVGRDGALIVDGKTVLWSTVTALGADGGSVLGSGLGPWTGPTVVGTGATGVGTGTSMGASTGASTGVASDAERRGGFGWWKLGLSMSMCAWIYWA